MNIVNPGGPSPTIDTAAKDTDDPNSIVCGRLDHPSWSWYAHTPVTRSLAGDASAFPYPLARTLTLVNADGEALADGGYQYPVTLPADAGASWQLHLDDVSVSSGSTGASALQVWDSTGTSLLQTFAFTATTTPANLVSPTWTLAASGQYVLRLNCNPSGGGQATFLCGRLRLVPVAPVSSFWANPYSANSGAGFVWYALDAPRMQDNGLLRGYDNPRFQRRTEGAHADFSTNAASFILGAYDNIGDFIGAPRDDLSILVDGYPLDPPLAPTIGALSYLTVAMPGPAVATQMRDVSIIDGPQALTGLASPVTENRGVFPTFMIAPAGASVQFSPVPAYAVEVITADSKGAWFYSTIPGRDSFVASARLRGVRIVKDAAGGGALSVSAGTVVSSTATGVVNFARRLCSHQPSKIHFMLGRNDFLGNTFGSTANLMEQIRNVCRAIHAISSGTIVAICTWTREATETDQDVSWEAARATMRAIVTTAEFASYCVLADLANLWSVAEAAVGVRTSDGVHPNDAGQQEIAQVIAGGQWPWTPTRIASCVGWWEADAGIVGASMTTPVATGTTPPTLTLSGTPAAGISSLRIECTTGGARGAALFRWSAGGQDANGRHWDATGVTTAASNMLGATGITASWANATFTNNNVWTSAAKVSQWSDLTGNGNHLVQATGAAQPSCSISADTQTPIAGSPSVAPGLLFSGAQALSLSGLNLSTYGFLVVAKASTTSGFPSIIGSYPLASKGALLYVAAATSVYLTDVTTNNIIATNVAPLTQSVYAAVVNGSSSKLRVNGVETDGSNAATLNNFGVGADTTELFFFSGTISLVLLFNAPPSAADILAAEAYAAAKYQTGGPATGYAAPAVTSLGVTSPITNTGSASAPVVAISAATGGAAGSMSAADKTKLDGMTAGAAVASVSGTSPIASSGGTTPAISIQASSPSQAGSMSAAQATQLAALPATFSAGFFSVDVTLTGGTATVASGKDLTNATVISIRLVTPTTATGQPVVTFVAGANGNVTVTSYTAGAVQVSLDASKYRVVFVGAA